MVENLNQPQMVCILVILNFGLIIVDRILFEVIKSINDQ